jgi:Methane oxygenase PmoA
VTRRFHAPLFALVAVSAAGRADEALRIETTPAQVEWSVVAGGHRVFTYRSDPHQFKPYVRELCTVRGVNVLADAPKDHLHHHGLMYAIRVNGLNFWEEIAGSGVEKVVATTPPALDADAAGRPRATVRQTLHWLPPQDAFLPDSPKLALLVEQRTLVLTVDAGAGEIALRWTSKFEVGGRTNTATLTGSTYFGLGARFVEALDAVAEHIHADGAPALAGTRQDVTPHDWCAVLLNHPSTPATYTVFGGAENPRGPATFFTMKRPFAYLSATSGLDKEPLTLREGEALQVDYLVTVHDDVKPRAYLDARCAEWRKNGR